MKFWTDIAKWKKACANTTVCLIGCSIGDFGSLIYFQKFDPNANMIFVMAVSMFAGLTSSIMLETVILKLKENFSWFQSIKVAFSMSFLSMIGMELAENMTDYFLTKGKVPISDPFYWFALLISMGAGFIFPLPYNYYKLKKYNKGCCIT